MKALRVLAVLSACSLGFVVFSRAQGPNNSGSETVARPKKGNSPAPAEEQQPKIPSKFSKKDAPPQEGVPTFSTDAITVTVDVSVLDNRGHFIPKIPKGNFRILEDNVPQQIAGYSVGEAPMTIAMVIEFSNRYQQFYSETWFQTLQASYGFVQTLKPEDYVAIIAYDLRPEILSDFSTDRQQTYEALQRMRFAGFSESNLYDALVDTAQRMQDIEGRKAILLIASGVDTFSKLTFDKARRAIQEAGVPIYSFGLMQSLRDRAEAMGALGPIRELDFLQADNQMKTFATESGGMAFFPHFYGEFPGIFQTIAQALRSQYVLTYTPANQDRNGKFRKIKVELVNPETNQPLKVVDEKQKPIKYEIHAKPGYTAPRAVE
ncbi:MAG: VWA domain-containing protein [Bryobacterales bacterium]|nr:VWA domain-containing protein [Bryobacterales bacterium]MBV9402080.1 VWA domain-containing protein [Bryobacterales bacterium]